MRSDFGFTDPNDSPPNAFLAVKITTLPNASIGKVFRRQGHNWSVVNAGTLVSVADINAGNLKFWPTDHRTGTTSFTFQVKDNGGTANGGVDLDPSPNTMTVRVVN